MLQEEQNTAPRTRVRADGVAVAQRVELATGTTGSESPAQINVCADLARRRYAIVGPAASICR